MQSFLRGLLLLALGLPLPICADPVNAFEELSGGALGASALACQDFDAYVNADWYARNPIPAGQGGWDSFAVAAKNVRSALSDVVVHAAADTRPTGVRKLVGDFWASGMDAGLAERQGLSPVRPELDAIARIRTRSDVASYIREHVFQGLLFDLYASPDFNDPDQTITYASPARLGLPDRGFYVEPAKRPKLLAYQTHVGRILELVDPHAADAGARAEAVVALETRLASVMYSAEQTSRDETLYYHLVPIREAEQISSIQWSGLFASLRLPVPVMVSQVNPAFHREVSRSIREVPVATWKDYFTFRAVAAAAPYLSQPYADEDFRFEGQIMGGQKQPPARAERIAMAMDRHIGEAVGALYVERAFPAATKAAVDTMAADIQAAMASRIGHLDWIGGDTKRQALIKLAAVTRKVGYPDRWRDWTGLVTSRSDLVGNIRSAQAFNFRAGLSRIGHRTERGLWYREPQAVSAYYRARGNEIVFPAGRLQPPFFYASADAPINFGAIGSVIGHELSHGFDDQGSRFDGTGRFHNWWTDADRKNFDDLNSKLIEQFNRFEVAPGRHVNGRLTLGENSADLVGLQVALDAMKRTTAGTPDPMIDGFTREQRFFMAYAIGRRGQYTPAILDYVLSADSHSPPKQRINGPLRNMGEFQSAFGCKTGDAMYLAPEARVSIW